MKIALFSDVHGRLRIVLHILRCWQIAHREMLDGALIAGDLGCFPDVSRFDKATRRWIERDPEEAGFPSYFTKALPEVEEFFSGVPERGKFSAVRCPLLFVPGNHEDYDYLQMRSSRAECPGAPKGTFPVDCYGRIHCIRDGDVVRLVGADGHCLRIAGLWGIELSRPQAPHRISDAAAQKLVQAGEGSFDLLLTHDVPEHSYPGGRGSRLISEVIRKCRPPLHLCGHAHPVGGKNEFTASGLPTRSWILEDVGFGKNGRGSAAGCTAILAWDGHHAQVELARDNWLNAMRLRCWQKVWPNDERERE